MMLSRAAKSHLKEWLNTDGYWERGEQGSRLRAIQDELIAAGRMRITGPDDIIQDGVRLSATPSQEPNP